MTTRDLRKPTGYSGWTDRDWAILVQKVHSSAPTGLSETQIRDAAFSYMHRGADGGGNFLGVLGTLIAVCVDEVQTARVEELS